MLSISVRRPSISHSELGCEPGQNWAQRRLTVSSTISIMESCMSSPMSTLRRWP